MNSMNPLYKQYSQGNRNSFPSNIYLNMNILTSIFVKFKSNELHISLYRQLAINFWINK